MVENQAWLGSGEELFLDGDNRKNFLRSENPHALCFWQVSDENEILSHSLSRLSDDVKVDSSNVPTTNELSRNNMKEKMNEKMLRLNLRKKYKNHLIIFLKVCY